MRMTIAQLSDLHLTAEKNAIHAKLRPLAAAIASADLGCNEYFVILSGDIANHGVVEEYDVAKRFFDSLTHAINEHNPKARVRYLAVPGNHDCYLPESDVNLRMTLVNAISTTLQTDTPDKSILESVLASQKNYFDFCGQMGFPLKDGLQRLYDLRTLEMGDRRIQFALYNTALLSTRDEQQGGLSVPIKLIKSAEKVNPECDLIVSVFHHPFPWLQADVGIAFRDHIEQSSEIVLTGHQHVDHAFIKESLAGEHTLYSEGDVLQDPTSPDQSGFRLIQVDTEERLRRVVTYRWKSSYYSVVEETQWRSYSRAVSLVDRPTPVAKFLEMLSDSGIGLTHRSRGPVPLDAVFVYPDATTSAVSTADVQKDVKGESLLKHLTEASRVIVRGSAYSGKTSLAKTVVKEWLRTRSLYPLLISGAQIKQADQAFVDRFINAAVTDTYGPQATERYRQLPPTAKALVIDDWDDSRLSNPDRERFLNSILLQFGKVVLLVRGWSYIHYLLARLKGTETILQFELLSLKEFSHVARGELIEKWLALELSRDDKDFSRKVEETERLVQSVIGKNTLPSLPLIVLAILEAAQRDADILPENGSFGYLYEVLITSALSSTQGDKPQLDKKYTFLSLLAFHLFDTGTDLLGERAINEMLDDYSRSYRVKLDKTPLLRDLERNRVLVKQDGNYSFGYGHYFYYFLARYFKNNINGPEEARLRQLLNTIAGGLNVGNNGIFLMFFIYLSHDDKLMDECVRIGDSILADFSPSDLTSEVEFYNSKDFAGIERQIPESVDLESSRRQRRQAADEARNATANGVDPKLGLSVGSDGYKDALPLSTKFNYAYGCIELLGQILRNFTGSLPGDRKIAILGATYLLGLRALRAILMALSDATVSAREEIAKRDPSKAEDRQFIKQVEKLLTVIGQILGVSMIQTISLSVRSPDIEEDAYAETLDRVGRNNATELVDLAIRLDHFEEYPFNLVKRLSLFSCFIGEKQLRTMFFAKDASERKNKEAPFPVTQAMTCDSADPCRSADRISANPKENLLQPLPSPTEHRVIRLSCPQRRQHSLAHLVADIEHMHVRDDQIH
jgi:hypothetical protein